MTGPLAPGEFDPAGARGYLDTATYGLPPTSTVAALAEAATAWRDREHWMTWEEDGEACRRLFSGLVGAEPGDVALVPAVSVAAGLVAASLPVVPGENVVLPDREFTSTVFPWVGLEARGVELRVRPLEKLVEAVDERTALVAVSAVQSADGALADLAALRETGVRLFVDGTQAIGAVPFDVSGIDYLAAHAYKWLLCPRGLAFLYVRAERLAEIEPWTAGWKSGTRPYESFYGLPRDLTPDARRLDVSLAWFLAAGGRRSLELIETLGIEAIAAHDLELARSFAAALGLPEASSPIVSVPTERADLVAERLRAAGVACSVRAGSSRFCFHLYNDPDDVALALEALARTGVFAGEA